MTAVLGRETGRATASGNVPERGVQHGLVSDHKRERGAVSTQAVQVFRAAVRADRTTNGIFGGKADDAAEVRREV